MSQGDKSSYTDKQKRQAAHIEKSEKKEGKSEKTAERIAWAEDRDQRQQPVRLHHHVRRVDDGVARPVAGRDHHEGEERQQEQRRAERELAMLLPPLEREEAADDARVHQAARPSSSAAK